MKTSPLFFLVAFLTLTACNSPLFSQEASKEAKISSMRLTEQGFDLLAKEQASAAVSIFDQAIAEDNKNIRAYQGKGIALNKLGKNDEAEDVYKAALAVQPGAVSITNNLAMSKILSGHYQEAIDLLTPLASTPTPNGTVVENLALANCLSGKSDDARKFYGKRLKPKEIEENLRFCKKFQNIRKPSEASLAPSAGTPAKTTPVEAVPAKQEWQKR